MSKQLNSGLYFHIPFCASKCIYCDFYSVVGNHTQIDQFSEDLTAEMDLYKTKVQDWIFDSIYFGGGTPSILSIKNWESIISSIWKNFNISENVEFTIEANPGEIDEGKLAFLKSAGVNRLSIGSQSFKNENLEFLGRIHSCNDIVSTYHQARAAGFDNINLDLIFSIPGQSAESWQIDLEKIVQLNPEHISAYSLTVEPGTSLFNSVSTGKIKTVSESVDLSLFQETRRYLSKAGYEAYEVSNFAKPGCKCRHNLHYWVGSRYLGLGPSAHSFDGESRWWNFRSLEKYRQLIAKGESVIESSEILSITNLFNEIILNGLRLADGIHLDKLEKFEFVDLDSWLDLKLSKWAQLELLNGHLRLKPDQFVLLDEITADLFLVE